MSYTHRNGQGYQQLPDQHLAQGYPVHWYPGQEQVLGQPQGPVPGGHLNPTGQGVGAPFQHLGQKYVNTTGQPANLVLCAKKCSYSSNNSSVTTPSGQVLFVWKRKGCSMSKKLILYDAQQKVVATIRQQQFRAGREGWTIYLGESEREVCSIAQDYKASRANVYLSGGHQHPTYTINVQNKGKQFQMHSNQNQLLAESTQSSKFFSSMMGTDKYGLVIQPGVDQAFAVSIAIALDEMAWSVLQYAGKHPYYPYSPYYPYG